MQTAGNTKFAARMAGHVGEQIDAACPIGQFAWLGLGTFHFVVAKSSLMGKPTGALLARVSYAEVARAKLTEAELTLRVDLDLFDGRRLTFETKRLGQHRPNVDVLVLLQTRVDKAI